MQTSALHITPSATAWPKPSPVLALAIASACAPTAPWPNVCCCVPSMSAAVAIAPTKFPV